MFDLIKTIVGILALVSVLSLWVATISPELGFIVMVCKVVAATSIMGIIEIGLYIWICGRPAYNLPE
jgi:hypothetical protein